MKFQKHAGIARLVLFFAIFTQVQSVLAQNVVPEKNTSKAVANGKSQTSTKQSTKKPAKQKQVGKKKANELANKSTGALTTQEKQKARLVESVNQLEELVKLGMPSLALRFVDEEQQKWPEYSNDWYVYEYKRVEYLAASEQWAELVKRTSHLLTNAKPGTEIIPQHRQWFATQQAIAQLQLSKPGEALVTLRDLVWTKSGKKIQSDIVALWRRLVVRAYVDQGLLFDAQKALIKYKQDYTSSNEEWDILQARVLLRTNRTADVLPLLKGAKSVNAKVIRLIAQVRSQPESIHKLTNKIRTWLEDKNITKSEYWAYRYILYESAKVKNDSYRTLQMAERLLSVGDFHSVLGQEFRVTGEALWDIYEKVGRRAANRLQLLIGDDRGWFAKASEMKAFTPIQARSLFAVLALNAVDPVLKKKAHQELVGMLSKQTNGLEIVNQLYRVAKRVGSYTTMPEEVRFRLIDYSLTTGEIDFAATLMKSISEPPPDEKPFDWRIRKARVLILEAQYEEGKNVLARTITELKGIEPDQLDRLLQVLFDLQAVDQNQYALDLFNMINEAWLEPKHLRELYFWKAESRFALKQYAHAARLYLKSARTTSEAMNDFWAHSARFKAGKALVKARLYDDAITMFKSLLLETKGEARKTLLKQEIQHIQLLKNSKKHV